MAYKLGWFSTGRGPGSRGLLTAVMESIRSGGLKAEISFVFCNREPGEHEGSDQFMALVKGYGIPLVCYSSRKFRAGHRGDPEWRVKYDREVMSRLEGYSPDLSVLAGYMLVVGPEMCRKYDMLNLHPALPGGPKGTWQEVIWQLIREGASESGAMMHLVTENLDEGPPVTYFSFPIRGEPYDRLWREIEGRSVEDLMAKEGEELPLFKLIREHGAARELPLIISTLKAFVGGRVRIEKGRIVDSRGNLVQTVCLNAEVERRVGSGYW